MRKYVWSFALLFVVLAVIPLHAATSTLTLRRATLTNVPDAAGSWQFEGGTVVNAKGPVGYFAATRRVTTGGTNALNTSMFTLTLFFTGQMANRNITLEGQWNFSPGNGIGGVSAASLPYQFLQHDGVFTMTSPSAGVYTLNITSASPTIVP